MPIKKTERGFTLLELLVASAIGIILLAIVTSMFKLASTAIFTVTQRAETQQNMRAAIELMTKDISLAGSGLPTGGVQLPTAPGGTPPSEYACNQTGTCYVPAHAYPNNGSGGANYMYGIIPGFNNGVQNGAVIPNAPGQINSSITSIYCDYNFPLDAFQITVPAAGGGALATVTVPNPPPPSPPSILAAGGLAVGDLLLFVVSSPGNGTGPNGTSSVQTAAVVGEITAIPNNASIDFAAGDALNFNQTGATITNNMASVAAAAGPGTNLSVCRLYAVTYFLQVPVAGGTTQTPRLMRQVNGQDAIPVADNIINLQITYDVINSTLGTISANQSDPIGAALSPGLIQKVNLWVIGESMTSTGNNSQSMYLASSVSARNMSFCNSYSSSTTSCN
jgi:prepilin-type N-terminal cleavage/methylation domain-containing protein